MSELCATIIKTQEATLTAITNLRELQNQVYALVIKLDSRLTAMEERQSRQEEQIGRITERFGF